MRVREVLPPERVSTETLYPAEWGIDEDCFVRLQHPDDGSVHLLRFVEAGATLTWEHGGCDDVLGLTFRRVAEDGRLGLAIGPMHRWVPSARRGAMPADVRQDESGLRASVRQDVLLVPHVPAELGSGVRNSRGYVGAWSAGEPIVEVMDFALGRPFYTFHPSVPLPPRTDGTVIYLGPPQDTWGHFLTQGLSRIWFALQHPDIPVLWDAAGLEPHQRRVIDLLGLRNPERFLTEPMLWEQVVFPFPGLGIGDYVAPAFTRAIGRIAPPETIAGKRVFLSRSALEHPISDSERALDGIAERHGFTVFHPEQHSVEAQLEELASAEIVLGVESSAFHSVLLLRDPVATRFWALSRHRGGSGIFEHLRNAKQLHYATLNHLADRKLVGYRSPLELDVAAIDRMLGETGGLRTHLDALDDRLESPWPGQTSFETHLRHVGVRRSSTEEALVRAHLAALRGDPEAAAILAAAV